MNWISYTKPFLAVCLLAGRAAAAAGFYLFGILIPAMTNRSYIARKWALLIGGCLLGTYLVFPLLDLLHWAIGLQSADASLWSTKFYRSQFSSAVGVTGLLFIAYSAFLTREELQLCEDSDAIRSFTNGFLLAGGLLMIYALVQLTTGFNFSDTADQRVDRLMAFGLYRVPGFTGHPVHFAGQCLPVFGFFWARSWFARPRLQHSDILIAGIFFVLIWFSGSRMGALVALTVLVAIPWFHGGLSWQWRAGVVGISLGLGLILTYVTGMFARILETLGQGQYAGLGNRQQFWRVHWQMFLDSPWIGWGHTWTEIHWRKEYYTRLGLGDFPEQYNAHNVYLEILANGGLIGMLAVVFGLMGVIYALRQILVKELGAPLLWGLFTLAAFGLTQNSLFDTPAQLMVLGLLVTCIWSQRPELVKTKES